jgi:hypothetical protein
MCVFVYSLTISTNMNSFLHGMFVSGLWAASTHFGFFGVIL